MAPFTLCHRKNLIPQEELEADGKKYSHQRPFPVDDWSCLMPSERCGIMSVVSVRGVVPLNWKRGKKVSRPVKETSILSGADYAVTGAAVINRLLAGTPC